MFDVELDIYDYKTVLEKKGIVAGKNETVKIENIAESLQELELEKAKGILVEFYMNMKTSIFKLNDALQIIHDRTNDKCEIFFNSKVDDDIKINEVNYRIIMSGL